MSGGLLSLKWNNHQSTFLQVLSSLCLNDTLSDVTLACEGEFYAAHRLVLATCSEYFEKIFEKIEGRHSVIVLKDVKAEEIEALLNYMYEGEVNVLQEKLSGLIKAAEYLKVKGLSDSDEAPEIFSRQIFKRNKRRGKSLSSHDTLSSPSAKRKRKDTDTSDPTNQSELRLEMEKENIQARNSTALEAHGSPNEIEAGLPPNEQSFEVEHIKEEPDAELKDELFSFAQDSGSQFLSEQNEYIPQLADISVPSVSSQPDPDKDHNSAGIMDEGSSTSSNLWEPGNDIQNLTNSTRIGQVANPVSYALSLVERGALFQGSGHSKRYHCPVCSYSTVFRSHLDIHRRHHTGEKPFSCQYCSYCSSTKSNMNRHLKAVHQIV